MDDDDDKQLAGLLKLIRFLVIALIFISLSTAGIRLLERQGGVIRAIFGESGAAGFDVQNGEDQ